MKKQMLIIFVALISLPAIAQQTNSIKVTVMNIDSNEGEIRISLFNSKETFLGKPFKAQSVKAEGQNVMFEFTDVSSGDYTISVYHDLNNNGELDKNFIGIPSEPYGISREGKSSFGPPNYESALFKVENSIVKLEINL